MKTSTTKRKRGLAGVLFLAMILPFSLRATERGKLVEATAVSTSDTAGEMPWRYLLYIPELEEIPLDGLPLLIFLHGKSLRVEDLKKLDRYGPPSFLKKRTDFPFITVCPQLPDGSWPAAGLNRFLDELLERYPVDKTRVCLAGVSLGAAGAWEFAGSRPERFAALVTVCAHGPLSLASKLTHLPIRAFHGAKDDIVPLAPHQALVEAINQAGGNAVLKIYPEGDHGNIIVPVFSDEELYQWMLAQRAKSSTLR
ncbi:MAG: dienelactone hydrolase family protein [Verrucomicrobiales bacterium]